MAEDLLFPFVQAYQHRQKNAVFGSIADIPEVKDREIARRAERLTELLESDVWKLDIAPILVKMYDDILEEVKAGNAHVDALKAVEDVVTRLNGNISLGVGALKRLAARRAREVEEAPNSRPGFTSPTL